MRDDNWRAVGQGDHAKVQGRRFRGIIRVHAPNPAFGQAGKERRQRRAAGRLAQKVATGEFSGWLVQVRFHDF